MSPERLSKKWKKTSNEAIVKIETTVSQRGRSFLPSLIEKQVKISSDLDADPGTIVRIEVPVAKMPTQGWVNIPVIVIKGRKPGPSIWLSAAIHGDELNGIETVHKVCRVLKPEEMSGTVYACPIVNVYGFLYQSRYLPDRRDLNRSFPGSAKGSLAGRIAHFFMTEIVSRCELGIDLHSASENNCNLPQIRANLDDSRTIEIAKVFGAPVVVHSSVRDGSLRHAAARRGKHTLVYEAGGSKRFDRVAVNTGKAGIIRVMQHLGILENVKELLPPPVHVARSSNWLRAGSSGIFHAQVALGDHVRKGDAISEIVDSFGTTIGRIRTPEDGIVIGIRENPLVYRGDALIHVASNN